MRKRVKARSNTGPYSEKLRPTLSSMPQMPIPNKLMQTPTMEDPTCPKDEIIRSVVPSSFEKYLETQYPSAIVDRADTRAHVLRLHEENLATYPHCVVLQIAFPEADFADRWCWQQFGPNDGECRQEGSEYPACEIQGLHTHRGVWLSDWLGKTEYDYGFNAWHFMHQKDHDKFVEYIPQINWGENYPKEYVLEDGAQYAVLRPKKRSKNSV